MRSVRWGRRFAEFVESYQPPVAVDAARLAGRNDRPEVRSFEFDGEVTQSLSWPTADGSTSSSPAQRHWVEADDPAAQLTVLTEALELPGTASDYHFAIQGSVSELRSAAAANPDLLDVVERLCWYDLRLGLTDPDAVSMLRDGEREWFRVTTLKVLVDLYEREGALREALEVARIAAGSFDQLQDRAATLAERLALAEGEVA